jgi:hypothetical protein
MQQTSRLLPSRKRLRLHIPSGFIVFAACGLAEVAKQVLQTRRKTGQNYCIVCVINALEAFIV